MNVFGMYSPHSYHPMYVTKISPPSIRAFHLLTPPNKRQQGKIPLPITSSVHALCTFPGKPLINVGFELNCSPGRREKEKKKKKKNKKHDIYIYNLCLYIFVNFAIVLMVSKEEK